MNQKELKNSKVSIILPHYNNASFVKGAIKSVINQTYNNWELIIIDGNSNINSKKVISQFKKIKK